jgi:peptidoglycan/xylan/chitin deacetylase (PgdA/CDA1 family)
MSNALHLRSLILSALSGAPPMRRLIILTFHRVLERADPLLPGEPTAGSFEEQLGWVSEFLDVIPLPDALRLRAEGRLPARAACITFDDGYRNNFEVAVPILERLGLPASFFIATGAIADGAMWNDLIIESVRACGARLDLREHGLGDYAVASESERLKLVDTVLDGMKYMAVDERAERSRDIYRTHCGAKVPALMMTPDMVRSLVDRGFDVGGHTMTHPILQEVSDDRADAEIRGCRDWLASVTGRSPSTFAYPNGRPGRDFDTRHRLMVREAGFSGAVATTWGCVLPSSDVLALPRLTPWEKTRTTYFDRLAKAYVQSYVPSSNRDAA